MTLDELLVSYQSYHRNPLNVRYHFAGVPLVTFGLFLFLSWFRFVVPSVPLTAATLFYVGVFIYYLKLSKSYALGQSLVTLPLLYLADCTAQLSFGLSLSVFILSFGGGWIFQLIGHQHEGRRPALVDNFWQIFSAPLFLTYELVQLANSRRTA